MSDVRYGDRDPHYTDRSARRRTPSRPKHPWGRWAVRALAAVLLLIGAVLVLGGAWLVALGGSWYYLLAGLGLLLSGGLLMALRMAGVWVYALVYAATWLWALWEVGWDGWPLVPRVVAPTVILILVLLAIPVLGRTRHPARYGGPVMAGLVTIALGLAAHGLLSPTPLVAQEGDAEQEGDAPQDDASPAEPGPALRANAERPATADDATGEDTSAEQAATIDEVTPVEDASPVEEVTPVEDASAVEGASATDDVTLVEEPATAEEPAAGLGGPDTPGAEMTPETGDLQVTEGETGSADDIPPAETLGDPDLETGLRDDPGVAVADIPGEDWPAYGRTNHATRYSPLDRITTANVARLERVWHYRTGDMPERENGEHVPYSPETTPIKIGDTLYLCSAKNILLALDAGTGREIWRYDPGVSDDAIPYGASCRGVAHHANPEADPLDLCAERIIEGTIDSRLIAVDARTGQPCADFGINGHVDLRVGLGHTVPGWYAVTSPPTIVRGIAVVGAQVSDNQAEDAPSGVVRGYDAVTGELAWAWDLGNPEIDGLPPEGETYTRGTPNMWTIAAGDEDLGHVYLPMGNSSVDYYGANRTEVENEYATALVALDATTGEPVWRFQTVHYDVWDYDLGSQPSLVDFPTEGSTVPAIILSSKQGDIFVLDRRTGESLFPVEERAVPIGGVEPENLSPTQPFSTYHSLLFPALEEEDMWGMSPIDQLWCRIQFRQATYEGIYTPPTADRPWIQYPGYNGGQDWGSMAVDTESGILIANYNDMPNYNRLIPREETPPSLTSINEPAVGGGDAPGNLSPQAGSPYAIDVNAGWRVGWTGLLCKEPPYGGIRAIDLATGETLWDQPLGEARKNGPWGLPSFLPIDIGTPNNGGPLVTAGGVVFIAAATDDLIRAIDIRTGEVLWEDVLPAGGQATPMTYEANGRQFLVFMAGGHHFMETPNGDHVIAWTLGDDEAAAQE